MKIAAILLVLCGPSIAQDAAPGRVPWTGSRVRGSPDAPPPYRTEAAFPGLRFDLPVDLVAVPDGVTLAVAELKGKIKVFENRPGVDVARILVSLNGDLFGLAFHPRFADNGFLYVLVALEESPFLELTRLRVLPDGSWKADPGSSTVLLRWPTGGLLAHNGGALRFGPDGFLYVGVGDGSEGMDARATGQDLGDLQGSILRIDVDRPPPGRRYGIPRDNPFAGLRGARPELWAFGVRQPWKMSFDPHTGELWAGDVGQDLWESVLNVRRGGNYGWSVTEGGHPYLPDRPIGPRPVSPPVVAHPHTELRALIGGLVYRGARLPDLAGSYVYGDHETGRIWELRVENDKVLRHRELATSPLRIIGFAEDARRELHILDYDDGTIHRLVPNDGAVRNADFPRRLSETGLFASVAGHRPAAGVVPYAISAALWSDGAEKTRFIALPGSSRIRPGRIPNLYVTAAGPSWDFPEGTVLVKTFSFEGRRIETRLLHLTKLASAADIRNQIWRGYSYQWNEDQTDAELVPAAGRDAEIARGGRRQTWRYPSRSQCVQCHSMSAHFILGATTLQMNREIDVPGRGTLNQLGWLQELGLFETALPKDPPRLVGDTEETPDLERRARAYLQANCAHCHVWLGGGNSAFQVHSQLPLAATGIVDAPPVHGSLGVQDARLVAPGRPDRSLIVHRMGLTGAGRMPPLASSVVDERGLEILSGWIRGMPPADTAPKRSALPWVLPSAAALFLVGIAAWIRKRCG